MEGMWGNMGENQRNAATIPLLKDREAELVRLNRELTRLNELKSEFTSMVSHELKNPLTAIKESISMVLEGIDGPITAEQRETLGIAKSNIDRLARLITNVLDLSKIEQGRWEPVLAQTNLRELMTEVCKLMRRSAQRKAIAFVCELPATDMLALCDPDKIKQIVINLIDNAIKFTSESGRVTVRLRKCQHDVCIEVEDSGIGIEIAQQQKIFDMFRQGSNIKEMINNPGAGVGLAVSKKLIEQHHGQILLESTPGRGSKFTVLLPLRLPDAALH